MYNILTKTCIEVTLIWSLTVLGILPQVGVSSSRRKFPRLTEAAVSDPSRASTWKRVRLRSLWAGLASFELACGWLVVTWEVELGCYNRLASAAATGRDARLHPKRATYLGTWTTLTFDRRAWGYKGPGALFLLPVWSWHEWVIKGLKITSREWKV